MDRSRSALCRHATAVDGTGRGHISRTHNGRSSVSHRYSAWASDTGNSTVTRGVLSGVMGHHSLHLSTVHAAAKPCSGKGNPGALRVGRRDRTDDATPGGRPETILHIVKIFQTGSTQNGSDVAWHQYLPTPRHVRPWTSRLTAQRWPPGGS